MIERSMKIFRTAASVKNFTEAASLLGMTQSNVTQQLAKLERELGVILFRRTGRKVELTPAGEVLLEECGRLFELESGILRKLRNAERRKRSFTLGATETAGCYLLIGLMTVYEREHPSVSLQLKIDRLERLQERLSDGELSLILAEEPGAAPPHCFTEPYCTDELVCVHAPGFLPKARISLRAFLRGGGKFILGAFDSGPRRAFLRFLRERGLPEPPPEFVSEVHSMEALKQLVQAGTGLAVLPSLAVENEIRAGVLRTASFTEGVPRMPFDFVYPPSGDQKFIRDFISFAVRRRGLSLKRSV